MYQMLFWSHVGFLSCTDQMSYFVSRSLFMRYILHTNAPFLQEITDGMKQFNLIDRIKEHPSIFRPLFCKGDGLIWTFDVFENFLKPKFSIEGNSLRSTEIDTFKAFTDVLEQCFYSGKFDLSN